MEQDQGKRPDQIATSERAAALALGGFVILIVIALLQTFHVIPG